MVVLCTIKFDNNPNGIYFAGQIVTGKILFECDKPKKVKGIVLKIKGFAHTSWSEDTSSSSTDSQGHTTTTTNSTTYSGHQDYIKTKIELIGTSGLSSVLVEPGKNVYNFSFHLPERCPSSFECQYGHIRYMVKVVLIRPWKFDQSYTTGITVLNIVNLNYITPSLSVPIYNVQHKTFGFWPLKSKPLTINVYLPQSGYVPGQKIPVSILITNESSTKVKEIKAELVMLVLCSTQRPSRHTKNERTVVDKLKTEAIVLRQSKKLFVYNVQVPATPPTCINMCSIIQIGYQIEVEIKVSGLHRNPRICIPVIIGCIPLVAAVPQQLPRPSPAITSRTAKAADEINLRALAVSDESSDNVPSYSGAMGGYYPWMESADIPPPSYEEATHVPHAIINADEKHDFGVADFVPRYPRYNINSPTAPTMEEVEKGFKASTSKNANS